VRTNAVGAQDVRQAARKKWRGGPSELMHGGRGRSVWAAEVTAAKARANVVRAKHRLPSSLGSRLEGGGCAYSTPTILGSVNRERGCDAKKVRASRKSRSARLLRRSLSGARRSRTLQAMSRRLVSLLPRTAILG
jgi:hypothetical protein